MTERFLVFVILFFSFCKFSIGGQGQSDFQGGNNSKNFNSFRDVTLGERMSKLRERRFLIKMESSFPNTSAYSVNINKKELSTDFVSVENSSGKIIEITHLCPDKIYYYDTPVSLSGINCGDASEKILQKFRVGVIYKLCLKSEKNRGDKNKSTLFIIPNFNSAYMLQDDIVFAMSIGKIEHFNRSFEEGWDDCSKNSVKFFKR